LTATGRRGSISSRPGCRSFSRGGALSGRGGANRPRSHRCQRSFMRSMLAATAAAALLAAAVIVPSDGAVADPGPAGAAKAAADGDRPTPDLADQYRDVLDRTGSPQAFRDFDDRSNQRFNPLLDQGAWHGFTLPAEADEY